MKWTMMATLGVGAYLLGYFWSVQDVETGSSTAQVELHQLPPQETPPAMPPEERREPASHQPRRPSQLK
ncbi:MAG: hypothetical protein EOP06_12590 [Proteobacteria bacterium]|nr:MAG: hypothetical protein EOP06_12590 [Pseudomonadota bacterium]